MLDKNSPHFKWLAKMVVALARENQMSMDDQVLIMILLDTEERVGEFHNWIYSLPVENGELVTTAEEIMNIVSQIGRTEDLRNLTGGIPIKWNKNIMIENRLKILKQIAGESYSPSTKDKISQHIADMDDPDEVKHFGETISGKTEGEILRLLSCNDEQLYGYCSNVFFSDKEVRFTEEKKNVGNRLQLLMKFLEKKCSPSSQVIIAKYMSSIKDEEVESEALKVMELMDNNTEQEVINLLNQKYLKDRSPEEKRQRFLNSVAIENIVKEVELSEEDSVVLTMFLNTKKKIGKMMEWLYAHDFDPKAGGLIVSPEEVMSFASVIAEDNITDRKQVGNRIHLLTKMSQKNYSQQSQKFVSYYVASVPDGEAEALKVMELVDRYTEQEVIQMLTKWCR